MAKYRITTPDGAVYNVTAPDGASQEEVMRRVQSQHQAAPTSEAPGEAPVVPSAEAPEAPVAAPRPQTPQPTAPVANAAPAPQKQGTSLYLEPTLQGLTFGLSDEMQAGGQALVDWATGKATGRPVDLGQSYTEHRNRINEKLGQFKEDHPVVETGIEIGSGLLTGSQVLRGTDLATRGASKLVQNAAGGAVMGAAAGAGYAEPGERLEGAASGAAIGAGTGAAAAGVAKGVSKVFKNRAATAAQNKAANQVRDVTLAEAQGEGYAIPPSQAGAGQVSRALEGLSGKAKTSQVMGLKNQQVTDNLVRRALNLPDTMPITPEILSEIRSTAYKTGYEPVTKAGTIVTDKVYTKALDGIGKQYKSAANSFPGAVKNDIEPLVEGYRVGQFDAGDAINATKILRQDASAAYRQGNTALAEAQRKLSLEIEKQIERGLSQRGAYASDTLDDFRAARTLIAKSHAVEDALNEGSGNIDALKLASQMNKGTPLTNELRTIGKFGQAFPNVARMPKAGDTNPMSVLDFASGFYGLGAGNPYMVALGPSRAAARQVISSGPYQKAFVHPSYGRFTPEDDSVQRLMRYITTGGITGSNE